MKYSGNCSVLLPVIKTTLFSNPRCIFAVLLPRQLGRHQSENFGMLGGCNLEWSDEPFATLNKSSMSNYTLNPRAYLPALSSDPTPLH